MPDLRTYYRARCEAGSLIEDPAQEQVLAVLDGLTQRLVAEDQKRRAWWGRFRAKQEIRGFYLWGKVGAGKSFVMDLFYEHLPIQAKHRVHFHAFMRDLQAALKSHENIKNPIQHIIHEWALQWHVLCFDEFVVTDIADAMLLGRVLSALIEEGVCVVLTSNVPPDNLYLHGLQRISFLPTIKLIKQHFDVAQLLAAQDYRLRYLMNAGTYHTPITAQANETLEETFKTLSGSHLEQHEPILICDRLIPIIKQAGHCIWFDFKILCAPPRSQHDYLELATQFNTVFISNIPVIAETEHNTIALFIKLIDILYDAKISLVCTAAQPPQYLYPTGRYAFEYQRTASRLIEMQSEDYVLHRSD